MDHFEPLLTVWTILEHIEPFWTKQRCFGEQIFGCKKNVCEHEYFGKNIDFGENMVFGKCMVFGENMVVGEKTVLVKTCFLVKTWFSVKTWFLVKTWFFCENIVFG